MLAVIQKHFTINVTFIRAKAYQDKYTNKKLNNETKDF
jgi:hypothetical protein